LASPRTLARIGTNGAIVERVVLPIPWIALFGSGHRLLFAQLHPIMGLPVLATARPRYLRSTRPWLGLLARAPGARGNVIAQNLVNCGLPMGKTLPCWFPGDTAVTLSDGTRSRRHAFPWINGDGVDPSLPLRDIAFVDHDRVWLLATSSNLVSGRHAAGRLLLGTANGRELARVDLNPPARALLFATDTRCVLLTVAGDLMEVSQSE
jgi:hypothetical protein